MKSMGRPMRLQKLCVLPLDDGVAEPMAQSSLNLTAMLAYGFRQLHDARDALPAGPGQQGGTT